MDIKTTEQIACMGFDAFRILQGMEPKTYTADQICAALRAAAMGAAGLSHDEQALFDAAWPEISKHGGTQGWRGVAMAAWQAALAPLEAVSGDELPEYARTRKGQKCYSLGYSRGRKRGQDEVKANFALREMGNRAAASGAGYLSDTARLDWLDEVNRKANERNGTSYGWKFDINHNRAALMDHNYPPRTIREAIDAARPAATGEKGGAA